MNRHHSSPDRPGDRPPGVPGNARFAGGGTIIGLIFIAVSLAADYAIYTNVPADYFGSLTPAFIPLILFCAAIVWLLNTGRLILVKLFRVLAIAVTAAYAGVILLNVGLLLYYKWDRPLLAAICLILLGLAAPLQILVWRDFRRCRWLDPASLPQEWEIAAIHDPNSINYRPPKPRARR